MGTRASFQRSVRRPVALTVVALVALLILAVPAGAGPAASHNPRILPPQSHPYGATYEQWAEQWYTWAFKSPASTNPVIDPTGSNAATGQRGPVWFLAGNFNPGTYTRTVTVPAGKALFFPLVNTVYLGFATDPKLSDSEVDSILAGLQTFLAGQPVTCKIDGVRVVSPERYTFQTHENRPFKIKLPPDNLGFPPDYLGFPAEWLPFSPCWQIGVYLMLAPPSPGKHTIHFTAPNFPLDITYQLTVKGGKCGK